MILLLLWVEVMVLCLFYLIYLLPLIQLIMIIYFFILEKYVGMCGHYLKLIKSYFSNRTQRVQIDDVLSDFDNIICGVPQGSVLGHLKFCLYLFPMCAILKYHKIGCCCVSTHSLDPCLWGESDHPVYILVHQSAYLSIWPATPSLQRGLSINPG